MDISTSITINAPASAVWAVLTDFPSWGRWSNFRSADGAAIAGAKIRLQMPGMSFAPTVTTVERGRSFGWAQTLISRKLFRGEHAFTLTDNHDGTTTFANQESFTGLIAALTGWAFRPTTGRTNGYTLFNQGLKAHVEHVVATDPLKPVR